MPRRPAIRKSDIDAAAASLLARGLRPRAIDFLPSGAIRFHIDEPVATAENELDAELTAFEASHGQG